MSKFNPFPAVNCEYGAPMGRVSEAPGSLCFTKHHQLCARKIRWTDGDYDQGGAYWGSGEDVWAVWERGRGEDTVQYVRVGSRERAIDQVYEECCA